MLFEPELNIKGEILDSDKKAIAIVGTRTPTDYGRNVAELYATQISKAGYTIVSGLARGIDSTAHKSALESGGRTIAVLGCGVDVVYPPENKNLYQKIIKNGAVVSEFPNGTKPLPENFLARNRIIAYLSLAILVVEGKRRSGTLSTARWAAEMGKDVFVVPIDKRSELSKGPQYLLENGAYLVRSPEELIQAIA